MDIEVRDDGQAFGRGRKVKGTFAAVIDAASHGDSGCYLSTQRRQRGADCIPAVMAEPLTSLATDFPLRPALLGDLVPQAVNLWMGHAPDGASSGPWFRRVPCSPIHSDFPAQTPAGGHSVSTTLCKPQACTTTSTTTSTCCFEAESVCGCSRRTWLPACTLTVACGRCTTTVRSSMPGRCNSSSLETL